MKATFRVSAAGRGGPLGGFLDGFVGELERVGYSPRTIETQVNLARHLSRWLEAHDLAVSGLDAEMIGRFMAVRRVSYSSLRSERALVPLLTYLRLVGAGVPPVVVEATTEPAAVMLDRFARFLAMERGLAAATVRSYVSQVSPFVAAFAPDRGELQVTARQVADFVTARAGGCRPGSVAVGATALRVLLRWMWRERFIAADMSGDDPQIVERRSGRGPPSRTGM